MKRKRNKTDGSAAILFVIPAAIAAFLVLIVPLAMSAYYSLTGWRILMPRTRTKIVWFDNYVEILTDPAFWSSIKVTLIYTVAGVSLESVVGLGLALLFRQHFFGRNAMRTLMILPMVITPAVVGMFWKLLYDPNYGVYNYTLTSIGLPDVPWLERNWALFSVILMDVWESAPFFMLVLLAGLQSEDKEAVEAARIDGARSWQIVYYLTLPHLLPYLAIAAAFRAIWSLSEFDKVYMLTLGGPGDATTTMSLYAYKVGFISFDIGKISAVSWIIAVLTLIVTAPLIGYLLRGRNARNARSQTETEQ
ncbi:carbohydrate ABC transporter permease [Tropicibacter sp. S64]|uniref:carbohydrate ABC transporter permease n=1 Tax=Tropicibacter sp. S64 TaxID=3415122 RepID=UPI003C7A94C6